MGGKGAEGKKGGQGCAGGRITLVYVHDQIPGRFNLALLQSVGDPGGDCADWPRGKLEATGAVGTSIAPTSIKVDDIEYAQRVKEVFSGLAVFDARKLGRPNARPLIATPVQ